MKKRLLAALLAASMMLTLAACGGDKGTTDGGTTDGGTSTDGGKTEVEAVTLKMNSIKSTSDPMYDCWAQFCDRVNEAANGSINLEIYPTESLGKTTDMIEAISKGSAVLQDCDPSHLADYVPDLSVFMMPYLFTEPNDIEQLWKSELGQELCGELEAKGLRIVTLVFFGERNLISKVPVEKRADTANLKIRCAATKMWNTMVEVLGGNATNTTWADTYQALSQGVADGCESPVSVLYSAKIHEVAPYLCYTKHLVATTCMVMSEKVYQSLPEDGKKAIDEVGGAYPAIAIEEVNGLTQSFLDKMLDEGVTEVQITDENREEFRQYSLDNVPQIFADEWTDGLVDRVLEAIEG